MLGKGKRLFADGAKPAALSFIDHKATSTGVSIDIYEVAGEPTYGSFELDEDSVVGRNAPT